MTVAMSYAAGGAAYAFWRLIGGRNWSEGAAFVTARLASAVTSAPVARSA